MPYNSFWRRLRRRYRRPLYLYPIIWVGTLLLYGCMTTAIITWLLPEWRGSLPANLTRWLWCAFFGFTSIATTISCIFMWLNRSLHADLHRNRLPMTLLMLTHSSVWSCGAAVALALGRVDIAVYIYTGAAIITTVMNIAFKRSWLGIPSSLASIGLAVAVWTTNIPLVLVSIVLTILCGICVRTGWRTALAVRPTRAAYLRFQENLFSHSSAAAQAHSVESSV